MHFFYVKMNILRNLVFGRILYVTMFTPEHSLLGRSIPFGSPGPPFRQAGHPSRPASPPGHHPTRPSPTPGPPPYPQYPARQACLPSKPWLPLESWMATKGSLALGLLLPAKPVCVCVCVCVCCKSTCNPLQYFTMTHTLQKSTYPILSSRYSLKKSTYPI